MGVMGETYSEPKAAAGTRKERMEAYARETQVGKTGRLKSILYLTEWEEGAG